MNLPSLFFGGWPSLVRIIAVGVPLYAFLLLMLRWAGNHSLAKNNAYGLVVTVSMGSALASAVLTRQVTFADGALAIATLLVLQYGLALWISRSAHAAKLLTQHPTLLLKDGKMLREAMLRDRVSEAEVLAAIRKQGIGSVEQVAAVVLESDGSFSVLAHAGSTASALRDVRGM
ncbi:MAG TPA: YetF domain-containing protein [Ramlibacter sp.]|uniref:DUF421 domain-containing protein n=1 Tax=Ramlibacter sp. TaxID=1917967 RepID=UPI002D7FB06C|nr:YetF domain-containing protein [Ramlibacter sp.]HET8748826.1 YetF domain-containing protein [Ramlibacter sp.]